MELSSFAIDGERLFDALGAIVIMSLLLERALAVVFENKLIVEPLSDRGLKEVIAVGVAFAVCRYWDFDAISVIFERERSAVWGHLFTAAIVAGGSKGAIKLFHDVLDWKSTAERERIERKKRVAQESAGHPSGATPDKAPDPGAVR